ncbi:PEP-CTERM sorting domain-containing protein [Roseibacillus persicicus]|uniref:PEP-CTERM sorting domain-containing protein n=1 Tax=Roseibacillus persicicus TaxID=454148 RepID=UPI00280EE334|nr:PEP-CTERM sorting domain-containing protein [Roseibacillus persicicus]MDQ8192475.1 PEP-CTERM sorting domain-containing protein [Roseibacillus persicicus]
MRLPQILGLVGAISVGSSIGQELTIDWGSELFPPGSVIDSNGNPISLGDGSFNDGGYTIELGAFDGTFVPTSDNTSSWIANWRVFDAIVANDDDPDDFMDPGDPTRFAGRDILNSDNNSLSVDTAVDPNYEFAQGEQAYVFIRNSNATEPGSEWLLYTRSAGDSDDWEYPFVSPESHNPADDLSWMVQDADSVVWGGINQGTTEGAGFHASNRKDYLVQTFTFVPEPTTALLTLMGSLMLMRRQRIQ